MMTMHDETFSIRGSNFQFYWGLAIGVILLLVCALLGYQLALGKPFWAGFIITLIFALFTLLLAIYIKSMSLYFENGYLIQKDIFRTQKVRLHELARETI